MDQAQLRKQGKVRPLLPRGREGSAEILGVRGHPGQTDLNKGLAEGRPG